MMAQVGSTGEAGQFGLRFDQRGAVATPRISRREVPDGVDPHILDPLWDCLDRELARPSPVTCILLDGALLGPSHAEALTRPSSPADLKRLPEIGNIALVREENFINRMVGRARQINSFVVTAVHGEVALQLAAPLLAADFRIISEQTTFVNLLGRVEFPKAEQFASLPARQLLLVKRAAVASSGELKRFLEEEREWI